MNVIRNKQRSSGYKIRPPWPNYIFKLTKIASTLIDHYTGFKVGAMHYNYNEETSVWFITILGRHRKQQNVAW